MNISTIRAASPPKVSWITSNAQPKDADFLTLRLLNKRTRARLSPQPLDLSVHDGRGNYFIISSTKGWFTAISRDDGRYQLSISPFNELRESIISSKTEGEDDFVPKRIVSVAGAPIYLTLALQDERLVVGFSDGSLSIYDTSVLFSYRDNPVEPLRTFPPGARLRQILGNPGDLPELVAIRRDVNGGAGGMAVEIINVKELKSAGGWQSNGTPETVPTSIAWSAKGKQLAIGLKSGSIVTYSPLDTGAVKLHVPRPPAVGNSSVISVLWLTNQAFFGIYAPVDDFSPEAPQKHVLILYDPKAASATQIELEPPYYPSPALRPPGAFTVVMRNWSPSKVLVFIGDSTSNDIGLVGSVSENNDSEVWCNLMLEETSTPSVPLDKDAEDTVPLSLDVDFSTGHEERNVPILCLYVSDGTLQAWFVSNEKGGAYPGMISPSLDAPSSIGQMLPSANQVARPFSQPTAPSAFGSTRFGSATATFVQPSVPQQIQPTFSSAAVGHQAPAPGFGQPASVSTFGQNLGSAFGASASSSAPKSGSTGFGFGDNVQNPSGLPSQLSVQEMASSEAEMSEESRGDADKLGGLSLGSSDDSKKNQDKSVNSMFGAFTQTSDVESSHQGPFDQTSGPSSFGAFGSVQGSGFIKPASGFGAYLKPSETQSADKETKPSPAFGASGFGTSGFGAAKSQSGFGQPTFGQSSFGSPVPLEKPSPFGSASPVSTGTSIAGFNAFAGASKGFSSFAQGGASGFVQQTPPLRSEAPTISMASSSEDAGNESSPTLASEQKSPSPVGTPKGKSPSSDATKASPSLFGTTTPRSTSSERQGSLSGADRQKHSAFSTPVARGQSPSSSPEGTPRLERKSKPEALMEESFSDIGDESVSSLDRSLESTTPFGTPAPSIFKTTGPVSTGGAFGNLTTTPSAFKPAEGFGAFGGSVKSPESSPFAKPKPVSTTAFTTPVKPVSAFGAGGLGPPSAFSTTPTDSATPKFGTPSTPKSSSSMFGKSSFGTPATPSPISTTPLTTPKGNAFTAYTGSGGFSAFANVDKASSFSDLLKSQKDESTAASAPSKPQSSDKEDETSFASISKPEEIEQDNLPPTPSTHGTFDEEEQDLGEEQEEGDTGSFISESFSSEEADEEAGEEAEEEAEGDEDDNDEDAEGEDEDEDEDAEGEEEEESEEGEGEEDKERESEEDGDARIRAAESATRLKAPSPVSIALPPSRESTPVSDLNDKEAAPRSQPEVSEGTEQTSTDSAAHSTVPLKASNDTKEVGVPTKSPVPLFPKHGTSGIPTLLGKPFTTPENTATNSAAPSPPPSLFGKQPSTEPASKSIFSKPLANVRSESTTPPGSPSKPDKEPIAAPRAVIPTASSSAPSGLGRPNSQPARSSPLASAPLSREESKSIPSNQLTQPTSGLKPRPASPKLPFGQFPNAAPSQSSSAVAKPFEKQEHSTTASVPKQPAFGTGQASRSAGNAPFIMPASAPVGMTSKPGPVGAPAQGTGPVRVPSQQSLASTTRESVLAKEATTLYETINGDIARVGTVREGMRIMSSALGEPKSEIHTREDLNSRDKWSMGDLAAFKNILKGLEEDVLAAVRTKNAFPPALRDLESNLLKAETRKEEVIRFSKAQSDPEFLRMLKIRTLSPDVAETRSQLRRKIRMMGDRIEKLEAHLKACKRKLEEHKKGKASIKPPPLDTLNRIYRNIDLAIESQTEQIAALASRIERLDIDEIDATLYRSPSSRRKPVSKRVGESVSGDGAEEDWEIVPRPQVTSSIAANTAAALNAERSAMRLKNALLKARQAPLLNTFVGEPTRRVEPPLDMSAALSNVSLGLSLDGLRTTKNASQRQRTVSHVRSVALRHREVPQSIASFEWGPLPLPTVQPNSTLPFQIKP